MVVDDDQRNVRLVESILKANGYRVVSAFDGEEALRLVEAERPDLLLLDVMMPKMSGLELCRRLKSRYETRLLPIVMVTALNSLEDKVQALEMGADDFLSKPINKTELLARVRSILRVKALQDEVERQRMTLAATNQQLMKMELFKQSLMQMVVHDLKNPLAGVMGNIQLIQLQHAQLSPAKLNEILERTQESGRQLMRMILNILDMGKLEEQKMPVRLEQVALRDLVEENMAEMRGLSARDGVRLENRVGLELPSLVADREILGRILANLLSNAFKHTPRGGLVAVEARQEGEETVLAVSDTGEGIPEDLLPYIFDKYVAGEPADSRRMLYDSGLGLTFCKLAVQRHGGRIWINSRPEQGTTVFVALPRTAAADPAGGASSTLSPAGTEAA